MVTKLKGITDNVTKIQRLKSSSKFYNLINQNNYLQNININDYLNLHKTILVITIEEQNSWSYNEILKSCRALLIKIPKSDVPLSTLSSQFFSFFLSLLLISSLVSPVSFALLQTFNICLLKIHEIDSSRTFLPHMQNESRQNAREASINKLSKNVNNDE